MRRIISMLIVSAALIMTLTGCAGGETGTASNSGAAVSELHASSQLEISSPDWVTALPAAQDSNVTQLFVVAGMGIDKTTATISMHQRGESGQWKQILSTPGYVGRNGMCMDEDHAEGCEENPERTVLPELCFRRSVTNTRR